jgi:hypothetical protein
MLSIIFLSSFNSIKVFIRFNRCFFFWYTHIPINEALQIQLFNRSIYFHYPIRFQSGIFWSHTRCEKAQLEETNDTTLRFFNLWYDTDVRYDYVYPPKKKEIALRLAIIITTIENDQYTLWKYERKPMIIMMALKEEKNCSDE